MEVGVDILLVDDDEIDLRLFARVVEKSGLAIRLRTLTEGKQAIDYLEAKGRYSDRLLYPLPDVVVLDLRMPQVNGFDFLAWRKASVLFSAIPVIVFSGSKDQNEIRRVFELGANKHIIKPQQFQGWQEVVREIWSFAAERMKLLSCKAHTEPRPEEQERSYGRAAQSSEPESCAPAKSPRIVELLR
jgi:two-component system response regulator